MEKTTTPQGKVHITAPITKSIETPDGGREVWGFATLEVVDKAGEIADFDGTVEEFQKWSSEIEKRTQGKSKGNVRVMHGATVAGKAIHWEPTETTIEDENGNLKTVKAIWTGAYIPPTKPDVIKDVDEGILSAFSIGGSYKKRWWDDAAKAFRFIPQLSEYSLVDNPCVPGADITQVISKSFAPWDKDKRNIAKRNDYLSDNEAAEKLVVLVNSGKSAGEAWKEIESRVDLDAGEVLNFLGKLKKLGGDDWESYLSSSAKEYLEANSSPDDSLFGGDKNVEKKAPLSFEDISQELYRQIEPRMERYCYYIIVATYPDHVIVNDIDCGEYYRFDYHLEDGQPIIDNMQEVEQVYVPADAQKMAKAAKEDRDKLKEAANKRAEKYGISFKEGKGHLTPPKDKPTDEVDYGDPTNYAYPIDSSHIKAAVSYFNQEGQQEDGSYSSEEWSKIGKRIAEAASKLEGGDYSFKDGKIVTPNDKKGAEKSMTREEIEKAAKSAGLSMDQLNAFFKAMQDAPIVVDTVDGDGDKDNNKEFPNPPSGDEKIDIQSGIDDVKSSEQESGVESKEGGPGAPAQGAGASTEKADGGELAKAGKKFSKKSEDHMKHAMNHIKAAMSGSDYGPDEHLTVENGEDGTNTGEEAPPVSAEKGAYSQAIQKAVGEGLGGMLEKVEAMAKGMVSLEKFNETTEKLEDMKKAISDMQALVKAIHDTPQAGGPILNGGSPDLSNFFVKSNHPQGLNDVEDTALKGLMEKSTDPMVKDAIGQELARRAHRSQFGK